MSNSLVLGGREEDCYHHQSDPSSFGSASHFWHPHIAKWDLGQKISNIIIIFPEKLGWRLCNDVIQRTCNIVTNLSISVWYGWRCEGNAPNIFCDWAVRLQMLVWLKMLWRVWSVSVFRTRGHYSPAPTSESWVPNDQHCHSHWFMVPLYIVWVINTIVTSHQMLLTLWLKSGGAAAFEMIVEWNISKVVV